MEKKYFKINRAEKSNYSNCLYGGQSGKYGNAELFQKHLNRQCIGRKRLHRNWLTLLFLGWVSCVLSASAMDTKRLSEMTVTADKFPSKEHNSSQFVQVFSASELQKTGGQNVIDALRRIGGLGYSAYAPLGLTAGMGSNLSIRGIEDGELVLVNGMPVQNVGDRNYNLHSLSVDQIERVEVMKGASSTLYGSDAMSGVINIITEKPEGEKSEFELDTEAGDFHYHNHSLKYSAPTLTLGFNYQHLMGMKYIQRDFEDNEYNHSKALDRYSLNFSKKFTENLLYNLRGSYTKSGYEEFDAVTDSIEESDDQEEYEMFTDLRYRTDNWLVKTFLSYNKMKSTEYDYPPKTLDEEDRVENLNTGVSVDYKFELGKFDSRVGGEYIHRAADFDNKYGYHYRNDYALYLTLSRTFLDRLKLEAGARQQFIESESDAEDYDEFVPSLGATYKINNNLNWYANTARAFRAPTFNNLYYDSWRLAGNPDLGPEKGWNYESGFKYSSPQLSLRLGVFHMDFEDKIESYKPGGYPYVYFNAQTAESTGIDWDAEWQPFNEDTGVLSNLALTSSGSWMDPTAENPDGEVFQTGAKLQAGIGVDYSGDKLDCGVHVPVTTSRPNGLDSITTVNLTARYQLPVGALTVDVNNLLDQEVEINGDTKDDNYLYYGMGRFAKIGYEITF